jgi:hypothetical protein
MLVKGLTQIVKESEKPRAICICSDQVSSIALRFTLTIGQVSHRTCVFVEKRMRKITIREDKSYVHYINKEFGIV